MSSVCLIAGLVMLFTRHDDWFAAAFVEGLLLVLVALRLENQYMKAR
jgi:hypothetical protein